MNRDQILKIVGDSKIFRVTFIKANGDERTMVCQFGVKKHRKGVGKAFKDEDHDIITVYEFATKSYKSFKADRVIEIKAHGEVISD